MLGPMTDGYRIRSPETWDQAREAYLAGEPAPVVCERFDIGLSAFRRRAREEGWRRSDQPDTELEPDVPDDELPDFDPGRTIRVAAGRMALAVERGRVYEALRWGRLHAMAARHIVLVEQERARAAERLRGAKQRAAMAEFCDLTKPIGDVKARMREAADAVTGDLHYLHDLHPVSPSADGADIDED
ncbi:hypothetical protein [Brevundimonas lenta]|uniref:Terminase small subunit n=1 Tax=Brevundimonas lenta TaxID=424796 RepID=A0A7W6JFQ2_9CAUL|nr:hypothetical protein [Brevundimonas lenta]MBB4084236.1 hypothetical protein [Brevundimonas lenta]